MKKICLSLVINLILFFFSLQEISAAVIINEVFPNPPAGGSEWVELFNQDQTEVSLEGWKLEDQLNSPTIIFTFSNQSLEAGQYLVTQLPGAKLNNDKDGVTLKDPSGNHVDMMSYESSSINMSWAREDGGRYILGIPSPGAANFSTPTPAPTPTISPSPVPTPSPTLIPTPSPTISPQLKAADLQLSEIYACPNTGENEWIEIYNSSNISGNLSNWKVKDDSDNQKIITANVNAHSLAVIEWTGSLLNNDGDSISLIDPNGNLSFSINFNECVKGQSYIFDNNSWKLSLSPTKNLTNLMTNPTSSPTPSPTPNPSPKIFPENSLETYNEEINSSPANLENQDYLEQPNPDLAIALPNLEIQESTSSSSAHSNFGSEDHTSSSQLISPPPNKIQVAGLLGTCLATASGSCWSIIDAQRKRDSLL